MWAWCLERNVFLSALYVPGILNKIAHLLSRLKLESTEWMLNPRIFKQTVNVYRMPVLDMFASALNHQVPKYFSWTLDPSCGNGRIQSKLEQKSPLHVSSFPESPFDRPLLLPHNPQILKLPWSQTVHPLFQSRKFRLAVWTLSGDLLKIKIFREGVQNITGLMETRCRKQYQSAWKQFFSWCSQRSCDPFSCSLNIISDYLVDLFYKGLEYRIINSHRSAISMTHLPVDGICVGSHPIISRFMKGIFNLRPPCPRYVQTWDVSVVLRCLKYLSPAPLLSMKNLTLKLVMLMALVSLSRANLLHKLVFKRDGILFTLPPVRKSSRVTSPPIDVTFPAFPQDRRLCIVNYLETYERQTKSFRQVCKDNPDPLFLSYYRPHRPIASTTVSRWLKYVLQSVGIDVSIYKGHSTRSAAASAVKLKGVCTSDILKVTDWSRETTLTWFYYRPLDNVGVGINLLS